MLFVDKPTVPSPMRNLAIAALVLLFCVTVPALAREAVPPASEPAQDVAGPGNMPTPAASPSAVSVAQVRVSDMDELFAALDRNAADARAMLRQPVPKFSTANSAALNALRVRLAADRDHADALATRSSLDARIVQAQIGALGPEPADGGSEPPAVTDRRTALNAKLGAMMEPVLRLRGAQARAATLVSELDARLKAMTNRRLMQRSKSPLDPRLWIRAVGDIGYGTAAMADHFAGAKSRFGERTITVGAVLVLALLALGPWLGWKLWRLFSARIERRILQTGSVAQRLAFTMVLDAVAGAVFAISLLLGVLAMTIALYPLLETAVLQALVVSLIVAGLMVAIGQWLGRGVLKSPFKDLRLINLPPEGADRALITVRRISAVLAAEIIVGQLDQVGALGSYLPRLISVVLVLAGAWLLSRLANDLHAARRFADAQRRDAIESGVEVGASIDFATPIGRMLKVFALAAVIASLVGFVLLARYIFSATLLTLGVIGIAVYLHRSFGLIVTALSAGRMRPYRRLLHFAPLLVGTIATIVVVPLIAVIWGYSANEILDTIVLLRNGVSFGDMRISAGDVFTFAFVFFIGYFVTRWLQRFLKVTVLPEFGMDPGAQSAILTFLGYIGITLAAVIAIATTGLDLSSLAFVAGALSVGLGFGLQSVVENFTSGVVLLVERPIKVGDWIEVGEHSGIVRKIAVRSTHVETFDRHQIIIPNSQLISGVVKNRSFSTGPARIVVPIGVAYGTDLEQVRTILLEIANAHEKVLDMPEPNVMMDSFGDSSVNVKILAFVPEATDGASTTSAINFEIARRFAEEGIEIPFPQRDLHLRSVPNGFGRSIGSKDGGPEPSAT